MWPFILIAIKLRKLELQTYQREKPPDNVENRGNGMWSEGKFSSLAENESKSIKKKNAAQTRE